MVAPCTCHVTSIVRSLFLLEARLYRRFSLDEGNSLVKLQSSLEFASYCSQNRFTTTPSLFWIYFVVFSLVNLLFTTGTL